MGPTGIARLPKALTSKPCPFRALPASLIPVSPFHRFARIGQTFSEHFLGNFLNMYSIIPSENEE